MAGPDVSNRLMQAAKFEHFGMMLFSTVPIPEPIKNELRETLGGEFLEGVTLEEFPVIHEAKDRGEEVPQALLCVSRSSPRRYEVIPYLDQVAPRGFEPSGLTHNVMRSEEGWKTFLDTMKSLTAHAQAASGVEPPDSPEVP
jgi:hypothetical protein